MYPDKQQTYRQQRQFSMLECCCNLREQIRLDMWRVGLFLCWRSQNQQHLPTDSTSDIHVETLEEKCEAFRTDKSYLLNFSFKRKNARKGDTIFRFYRALNF